MWFFARKNSSGFSSFSTAEEVTREIDGSSLTAIVTGASSGVGVETTRVLALRGVHVIMAVRNMASGAKVRAKILEEIPRAKVDVMELDLSSMASVRKFASEYNSSNHRLNILMSICHPIYPLPRQHRTAICNESPGSFLLTHLLLDTMKNTTLESGKEGRIVNVSSEAHRFTNSRFDKLNISSGYSKYFAYCRSKLANVLHANELARHLKNDGVEVTANSIHPGGIYTNIFRYDSLLNGFFQMLSKFFLKDIQRGAATTCYVALHPQVKGISGEYFSDCDITEPSKQARNIELARNLWDISMDLIKQFVSE